LKCDFIFFVKNACGIAIIFFIHIGNDFIIFRGKLLKNMLTDYGQKSEVIEFEEIPTFTYPICDRYGFWMVATESDSKRAAIFYAYSPASGTTPYPDC